MKLDIEKALKEAASMYPIEFQSYALADIKRTKYNIETALIAASGRAPADLKIVDLGGNFALFSVGCALLGFKEVTVIDDFSDPINIKHGSKLLDLHKKVGIRITSTDLLANPDQWLPEADVYTTFDSLEHWHHSPKLLLNRVSKIISKNSGGIVIGVPNCVNIRKRLSLPFGYGKWSSMEDWYENEVFRGHVREPDVDDLVYIANDMKLDNVKIKGRNWVGYANKRLIVRMITPIVDKPLRLWPGLCGDIYMIGSNSRL